MTIHSQRKLSVQVQVSSRTSIINNNSSMILLFPFLLCCLASFDLSSSFVPQQQQQRRGGGEMGRRIQSVNQHKSTSGTTMQLLPRLSSPLLAQKNNNNNNNVNSTSTSSYAPTAATTTTTTTNSTDTDDNTVNIYQGRSEDEEDDQIRLQRFMEEALSELESFQATATTASSSTTSLDEVSLLFPESKIPQQQKQQQQQQIVNNSNNNSPSSATSIISIIRDNEDQLDISLSSSSSSNSISDDNGGDVVVVVNVDVVDPVEDEKIAAIWRARWLLVAAAALYGTNFSVVKLLGDEMPVSISSSLRFGLATFATLPWLLDGFLPIFPGKNKNNNNKDNNIINNSNSNSNSNSQQLEGINKINTGTILNNINHNAIFDNSRVMATLWGLEVGMWNSFGYVAQAVGLETTLASKSAFLCSMAVVIVPLLDWMAGKKLIPRQWIGAMVALVGVAFLELGGAGAGVSDTGVAVSGFSALTSDITPGDLLSMVQPFAFGLGFWRMEKAMNLYPEEAPRMTAAQLMAVFISSLMYGLYTLDVFDSTSLAGLQSSLATIETSFPWKEWFTDPSILFSLFWTGCITTALTIYMETLALETLSASETTLIFSTEPLWGTAVAVALMGEQVGMNAAVGGSLILAACLYSNLGIDGLQSMLKQGIDSIKEKGQSINPS